MNKIIDKEVSVDIVLVNPPSSADQEFGLLTGAGALRPPLNLLNLGATLLESGHTVSIVDGPIVKGGIEAVVETIVATRSRYIGFTAMTAFIHTAAEVAAKVKEHLTSILTIIGGIHVSTLPEETLELFPSFDIGVAGEGDFTIVELIEGLKQGKDLSNIPGLVLRIENRTKLTSPREHIKNLDILPMPAWHLLPNYIQAYQPTMARKARLPSAYIVTSRGCPFPCTFCNNVVHGRRFRSYSVDYIMRIVEYMVKTYHINDLTIYDENLPLNRDRVVGLCERLKAANYDLTWSCDARADCVDDEILSLMYKGGCRSIWYGMESGNADILKRYQKKLTLKDIERAVHLTRKHAIKACGSFIIGGSRETPRTIKDTIQFAKKLRLDHFVPIFYTPIPGTSDYSEIRKYGIVDLDYRSATMTRPTFAPHGMTFMDMYYWYIRATLCFYLRPSVLLNIVRKVGTLSMIQAGFSFVHKAIFAVLRLIGKRRRMSKFYKV